MDNIILNDVTLDVVGRGGEDIMMIPREPQGLQGKPQMIGNGIVWFFKNIWNGIATLWGISTWGNMMNFVIPFIVLSCFIYVIWKRWTTRHLRKRRRFAGECTDEALDRQVISDEMKRLEELWQYGL